MDYYSKNKTERRKERDRLAGKYSKAHGYDKDEIKEMLSKNTKTWGEKEMDRKAMANVTNPDRYKKGIAENISQKNMRHLGGLDTKVPDKVPLLGGKTIMSSQVNRYVEMAGTDFEKSIGHKLSGRGVESGFGHTLAQAKMASFTARSEDLFSNLNPLGASMRESVMMSMGFTGRDSKILAAKGNFMEGLNRRLLAPAFGIAMAYGASDSDTPLTDYATGVAAGAGLQQGWRAGKSFANVIKPSHKLRIAMGGAASLASAGLMAGAVMGQADMFKNDSFIGKQAKKVYSREMQGSLKDTQTSLTMRQAGLEKLSSSYLNNRQQLLGNEASVLRNAQA